MQSLPSVPGGPASPLSPFFLAFLGTLYELAPIIRGACYLVEDFLFHSLLLTQKLQNGFRAPKERWAKTMTLGIAAMRDNMELERPGISLDVDEIGCILGHIPHFHS